jgi:hypothetical protein
MCSAYKESYPRAQRASRAWCSYWFYAIIYSLCWYTGARRARDVVYRVLSAACEDGDLSIQEAIDAVEDIFRRNALDLYKLNVANGSIHRKTTIIDSRISTSCVDQEVLFVRIVWNDASGQHRCRVSTSFQAHAALLTWCNVILSLIISRSFMDKKLSAINFLKL